MRRSNKVRAADVMKGMAVLGSCLEAGADRDGWPTRLMEGVLGLLDGQVVIAAEMKTSRRSETDPPGLGRALGIFRMGWPSESAERKWTEYANEVPAEQKPEFPVINKMLRGRGGRGVTLTRDAIWGGPEVWERSRAFTRIHRECGIDDYIFSIRRLERTGTVSSIWVHRAVGDPSFTPRERRLLSLLHDHLAGLVGGPLASAAEPGLGDLPPRPRQVLDLLLAGITEQEAADELGLSKPTVHEHARRVYGHFGVSSRAELLANFIGRAAPPGAEAMRRDRRWPRRNDDA